MRHFTVDEANALLPVLKSLLQDLREVNHRRLRAAQEVQAFEQRAIQNGHGDNTHVFSPEHDLRRIHEEMAERLRYLQELGVHLKDIENGVVDFPTRFGDRDVYLCWHVGEDSVSHWHEIEAGFAGRQPL